MSPVLFLAQRVTALILALAVTIHLATILYATQQGLTAGHILQRTHGNGLFFGVYVVFVAAAAVHAPIGLRNIFHEWLNWRGRGLDLCLVAFAVALLALGLRAAYAVYVG